MTLEILSKNAELAKIAERIRWGIAGEQEVMSIKSADFLAIRTDPGEMHVRTSVEAIERAKGGDESPRVRRYVASDETPDRYGDIIRVSGWDFANFKKNPVALWGHNDYEVPIGKVVEFTKGEHKGKPALLEAIDYFDASVNPLSETVLRLVDAGGIRAVSVGFIPHKSTRPNTPEERLEMGLGPWGVEFNKVEQIELSNCTIPANPNALLTKALVPMVRDMESSGQVTRAMAQAFYAAAEKLEATERRVFALGAAGASGQSAVAGGAAPAATSRAASATAVLEEGDEPEGEAVEGGAEGELDESPEAQARMDREDAAAAKKLSGGKPANGKTPRARGGSGGGGSPLDALMASRQAPVERDLGSGAAAVQVPLIEAPGGALAAPALEARVLALEARSTQLQKELDETKAALAQSLAAFANLLGFVEQNTKEPSAPAAPTSGQGATKTLGAREQGGEVSYLVNLFAEGFERGLNSK